MGFWNDPRYNTSKWYTSIDEDTMEAEVEWYDEEGDECSKTVKWSYGVCSVCRGKGSHVNPSIDDNGISGEDFYDDPDFAEAYFSGAYDVPCNNCGGKRVAPVCSDKEHLEYLKEKAEQDYYDRQVMAAEMGWH